MRTGWRAAAMLLAASPLALAQTPPPPPVTATPLAPPAQFAPPVYPTPGAPLAPTAPLAPLPPSAAPAAPQTPGAPPAALPNATAPSPGPAVIPNTWLPQGAAILQGLDKVNAQSSTLTVKVGQSGKFGSLTIAVQACSIRPPDQAADAAAYLVIADSHPDAPGFKGWMLKQEPEVNMLEHPVYDIRVIGCAP